MYRDKHILLSTRTLKWQWYTRGKILFRDEEFGRIMTLTATVAIIKLQLTLFFGSVTRRLNIDIL